jgi:hypothetical protein
VRADGQGLPAEEASARKAEEDTGAHSARIAQLEQTLVESEPGTLYKALHPARKRRLSSLTVLLRGRPAPSTVAGLWAWGILRSTPCARVHCLPLGFFCSKPYHTEQGSFVIFKLHATEPQSPRDLHIFRADLCTRRADDDITL